MTLSQTLDAIRPLDEKAMEAARNRWNSVAKPLGSLGLLEDVIVKIAGITRSPRIDLSKRAVVAFCADNGVVQEGVTQCDSSVTAVVTENFSSGDSSVCKMAAVANARVVPVDIGVAREVHGENIVRAKVAYGTKNMALGPAMSRDEAVQALEIGIRMAQQMKEEGCRILATGEMGIGNTTTSSALTAVFLQRDPQEVTGRGAGLSSEGLMRKVQVIRRAIQVNRPNAGDALDTLSKVGGLDIAGMAGLFLGGAALGIPVLIDGFISAAAALTAVRLCPAVREYLIASHVSREPAGSLLMRELGAEPFLDARMCLGEGTGAVAVLPILDMAAAVYSQMSTFAEIQIEEYKPLV